MHGKESSTGPRVLKPVAKPDSQSVIKVGSDIYVRESSIASRRATRVLVNGRSFAVFEAGGDVLETPREPLGFFHRDTRYLSRFELKVAGEPPHYLNSYPCRENAQIRVNLSNPDLREDGDESDFPSNSIQIERNWVIAGAALFHKMIVHNYARAPMEIPLEFLFGADFADLFEVRGLKRARRGEYFAPAVERAGVRFSYRGLDGTGRSTRIEFDSPPASLSADGASFVINLEPDGRREMEARIEAGYDGATAHVQVPRGFDLALAERQSELARYRPGWSTITTSNELLNNLLGRSAADLTSIIQYASEGSFVMAGVPWFATLFGRDSLLTAFFLLPFNPALAVGTLKTLASLQGTEVNHARDEEPGKILHEMRGGEAAATGEVPFGRYYGSIDSTPLFVWLIGEYAKVTGDLKLPAELWSNVERALEWIELWGDRDGDLFLEYKRETPRGLANQGWKDSFDSISHADGTLARAPIALCEVQAYVYAAYVSIAGVARRLGRDAMADRQEQRAAIFRDCFLRHFWLEDQGTVALALDADKQPCRVMASNAAHCLTAGLLDARRSEAVVARLLSAEMFSGWGIRTLGSGERRYNPMSYHNGSIWPHDNAMAALGLMRSSNRDGIARILEGHLQAAVQLKTGSLPELFCGFRRDDRLGPVPYPVACHPQAWSAASIFAIVGAMLGLHPMGFERRLVIDSPALPEWLDWIRMENIRCGDGSISFLARRDSGRVAVEVLERRGGVTVEVR